MNKLILGKGIVLWEDKYKVKAELWNLTPIIIMVMEHLSQWKFPRATAAAYQHITTLRMTLKRLAKRQEILEFWDLKLLIIICLVWCVKNIVFDFTYFLVKIFWESFIWNIKVFRKTRNFNSKLKTNMTCIQLPRTTIPHIATI